MACGKTVFFLFTILASLACVPAEEGGSSREENSPPRDRPPPYHQSPLGGDHHERAGFFGSNSGGLPNFGQLFAGFGGSNGSNPFTQFFGGSNGSDPFSQLVSTFGQFIPGLGHLNSSGLPNLLSGFLPQSGRSQRLDLLPSDLGANNGTEDMNPHDRFFFSLFHHFSSSNVPIGCNYTTQAGYSCAGCREQLLCNTNNVGRIRICPFYAPYCYNGVCGSNVNTTCTNSTG